MRTKDGVFEVFKHFQANIERQVGKILKCIRSCNGGEYRSTFAKFCKANGIKHERTVPKIFRQNGVAERINITILDRIRCMLSHAKLPKSFWGEAMMTTVELINLSPLTPLNGKVLESFWIGKKASYEHLKVFGCKAFVHNPKNERSKLDGNTKQCIFLGQDRDKFKYRLWDAISKKIVRSRDVILF